MGREKMEEKGGEEMSLEAIKQVTETEQQGQQRKAEAAAAAKKAVADAERAGQAALEEARTQAEAQVSAFMKEAEERASKHTQQVLAETGKSCDALRKAAEGRMKQAAALIVGRVVNS